MKKIQNLNDLDQRIHELREKERQNNKVIKDGVSQARHTSEQFELAFYIGKIATQIFRSWNKPNDDSTARWKNIIISILMITGIHFAQRYLNDSTKKASED